MLVLSRKKGEKIVIGDDVSIVVIEIRGDRVRLGIEAPRDVCVYRSEVCEAMKRENAAQKKPSGDQVAQAVQDAADATRPFHLQKPK